MMRIPAWRQLGLLAANDVRLTVKDKTSFVWMLLFPVALMWFFGASTASRSGGPPKISLTVDDRDRGWLSRALVDELAGDQVSLAEVGGDAEVPRARTLVIPEGLTEKVLAGEQQTVRLEVDPEADATFGMGAEVHVRRAIVRVLGRFLEARIGADGTAEAETLYRDAATRTPAVVLDVSTAGEGEPVPSGFAQSVPGNLTMIVLMMTLIYGGVFLVLEKQQGMLRRQLSLPIARWQVITGKVLGRLLIASLQIVLLLTVARVLFGLSLGSSPLGLLMLTASYAFSVACLSVLLGAVFATTDQVSMVGWIGSMILAGLGGCWWPSEVMPEWLRTASHVLPTAWAMDGFHALISFGRGPEAVWLPSLVLVGFGVVAGLMGMRRLGTAV